MTDSTSAAAATAPAKPVSLWEDFVDVLYAPASVFARRRGRGFGLPLLIVALLAAIVSGATLPLTRPILERQMEAGMAQMRERGMTDEQIASARGLNERIMTFTAVGGPAVGTLIVIPIIAAVLWGVARLFGGQLDYSGAGLVSTYSVVPTILVMLVGGALLALIDASTLPPLPAMTVGPVLLLDRDASPVLTAVVSRFGVAEIWGLVITAVGLRVIGRMSNGAAWGVSLVMWAIGSLFSVLMGLRAAAAAG